MTIRQALAKVNKVLEKRIDDILDKEVATAVKVTEYETISEVVYGVYEPKMYSRRGEYEGIGDYANMEHTVKDGKLTVVNTTEPNDGGTWENDKVTTGKHLDQLIEYGHGGSGGFYDFPKRGAAFMKPRPFTAKTIEHLAENKLHVEAMRSGLKRKGFQVE